MAEEPLADVQVWEFTSRETGETRRFTQRQLTIDGEVHLFDLANRGIQRLTEKHFPWEELRGVLDTAANSETPLQAVNWREVSGFVTIALTEVPALSSEMVAIMLGIFPTDERGLPDDRYDKEVRFIRQDLRTERLIEMLKVFMRQNDYERLSAPFANALRRVMDQATPATPLAPDNATPEPSTSSSTTATART